MGTRRARRGLAWLVLGPLVLCLATPPGERTLLLDSSSGADHLSPGERTGEGPRFLDQTLAIAPVFEPVARPARAALDGVPSLHARGGHARYPAVLVSKGPVTLLASGQARDIARAVRARSLPLRTPRAPADPDAEDSVPRPDPRPAPKKPALKKVA